MAHYKIIDVYKPKNMILELHFISDTKQPSGSTPKSSYISTAGTGGKVGGSMSFLIIKVVKKHL